LKHNITTGDVWGGLSATAVMLPQATAFGIALWAPYSQAPAIGALAGLITAIALCLFSGISKGTTGMVSSPTGPTLVLLSGALATMSARGISTSELAINLSILIFIAGIFQIIIALSNGGRLIKFIPYPVVAGFMTGSAILMISSQLTMLDAQSFSFFIEKDLWIPWLTALITFFAMSFLPKIIPALPGTVSGLITGVIVFHGLAYFTHFNYPTHMVVGSLPDISTIHLIIPDSLTDIPWKLILPISLALAILSSLDSLLTSVLADVASGHRHNAKRELTGQGVGHMLAALFGGIAGAGTTGATLTAINSGGRQWAALLSALFFLLIIALVGSVAALLPVSVLAGIIFHVAIFGMLERDVLTWIKRRTSRMDALTALLVTGVTVTYDLMIAVGVGIVLALFHFVRAQFLSPVIHRRSTIDQLSSLRRRSEKHRDLLTKHNDRIVIYELTGNLFFGTVDRLFEEVNSDLIRPAQIILDMARVQQVDLTAVRMFQHMSDTLHQNNGELIFTNVRSGKGLSIKVEKTLRRISPHHSGDYPVKTFIDSDEAKEYAENKLLEKLGEKNPSSQRIEFEESTLFHGLHEDTLVILKQAMDKVEIKSGDFLFKTNDHGKALYVVIEGEIDILLPYGQHHYKRLAKFGAGSFFGEIAFLKPGKRTADAKAMHNTELLILSRDSFQQLRSQHPKTAIKLLMRLGREMSDRLRWSDSELRRLAE
jgi:sulfate permease, SulP family